VGEVRLPGTSQLACMGILAETIGIPDE